MFELAARLAGFADAVIPITVTVSAVASPTQPALAADYAAAFSYAPVLPDGLQTGAELSVAGASDADGDDASNFFALANGQVVPGAQTPPAGNYEILLAMTNPDLLGTLTLTVSAEVAPAALAARYGLPGLTPEDAITVAAGYAGSVYAVALADDITDAIVQLPGSVSPDDFALALSPDSRTVELRLTAAASAADVSARLH